MIVKTYFDDETVTNESIDIELIKNGISTKKTIDFVDYCESISPMYMKQSKKREVNVWCQDILNISIKNNEVTALFKMPSFDLFLTHNHQPTIWKLPNIICECTIKGNLRFWAIKSGKVGQNKMMYSLNLPHHYTNGTVCYGSFVTRRVEVDEMFSYAIEYLQTTSSHQITKNLVPTGKNSFKYKILKSDEYRPIDSLYGDYTE